MRLDLIKQLLDIVFQGWLIQLPSAVWAISTHKLLLGLLHLTYSTNDQEEQCITKSLAWKSEDLNSRPSSTSDKPAVWCWPISFPSLVSVSLSALHCLLCTFSSTESISHHNESELPALLIAVSPASRMVFAT